ncbi:MAG TPA: hypothetical protein VJ324_00620 [Candidatus Acidoferrum sp.]|nr:hypothetical protein [Candidatus Acidoferrum sp.]
MKSRLLACAVLALSLAAMPLLFHAQTPSSDPALTAHEWGTFTSIAGKDGQAAYWLPLTGSTDLPAFVEHFQTPDFKGGLRGTVRMETPVLYFYTNRATTVSVRVSFSQGLITEWYPHADRVEPVGLQTQARMVAYYNDWNRRQKQPDSSISWDSIALEPSSSPTLPDGDSTNHYYAARQTSSTPLRIKTQAGDQTEKFLFYRGVGSFSVPMAVKLTQGEKVVAQNLTTQEIPAMLLFECRGDKLGFRVADASASQPTLDPPELNANMDSLKQAVEDMLIAQGLYQDEAQAMFETWRDSWFEEGSRLLYIVPRQFVDSVLPLSISPVPAQTVRVFVGRLELVTPATQRAVEQALVTHDQSTLNHYGRFLAPILETMIASEKNSAKKAHLLEYLNDLENVQVTQNAQNQAPRNAQ